MRYEILERLGIGDKCGGVDVNVDKEKMVSDLIREMSVGKILVPVLINGEPSILTEYPDLVKICNINGKPYVTSRKTRCRAPRLTTEVCIDIRDYNVNGHVGGRIFIFITEIDGNIIKTRMTLRPYEYSNVSKLLAK